MMNKCKKIKNEIFVKIIKIYQINCGKIMIT